MPRRSRKKRVKANAASAGALAIELAQDRKFRDRLLSSIGHGYAAGQRARHGLGWRGAITALTADQTLLRELRSARSDLEQAHERLEAKRRTHKLRNLFVLAALASLAVPQFRARLAAVLAKASKLRQHPPGVGNSVKRGPSDDSRARPQRLEDLTKDELYARAQEADVPGRSEMSKEQLIEALRARN